MSICLLYLSLSLSQYVEKCVYLHTPSLFSSFLGLAHRTRHRALAKRRGSPRITGLLILVGNIHRIVDWTHAAKIPFKWACFTFDWHAFCFLLVIVHLKEASIQNNYLLAHVYNTSLVTSKHNYIPKWSLSSSQHSPYLQQLHLSQLSLQTITGKLLSHLISNCSWPEVNRPRVKKRMWN